MHTASGYLRLKDSSSDKENREQSLSTSNGETMERRMLETKSPRDKRSGTKKPDKSYSHHAIYSSAKVAGRKTRLKTEYRHMDCNTCTIETEKNQKCGKATDGMSGRCKQLHERKWCQIP